MPDSKPNNRLNTGCGYMLVVTFVACVLLLFNSFLVYAGLESYESWGPDELRDVRARQSLQFILPVFLIFMEYWLYDHLVDRFVRSHSS